VLQLEAERLRRTLARMQAATLRQVDLVRPSPLGFPLLVDRLREKLTSEKLEDRVRRLQARLEKEAGVPSKPVSGRKKRSRPAS
jgi:ATP-dependent Lhr-like helicase